jgi:hypothetical protein
VLFTILLFGGIGAATVGGRPPAPGAVIARVVGLLAALAAAGLLTPFVTTWARSEATETRIIVSVLLLAPPAFFMGMMFPLGLSVWRRHTELLPFFWCANGITSMFASVLGMILSIEFGIARTYALGACFYVVCAIMIVGTRQMGRVGASATTPAMDKAAAAATALSSTQAG